MVFKAVSEKIDFDAVKESTTLTGEALAKKQARDKELEAIIKGEDNRTLLVIGPCSSDNEDAVLDYAHRLAKLQEEVKDKVFMVMRVYTAKPRTNGDGYKGLVHQPDAEGKPNLINGIKAVRNLHYRVITETGITTADEMLYPENLPLVDDLVSYIAIGARSVEDQQHRFVASGIDVPTGMKNPTSGNLNIMFNGIYAAQNKQDFLFNGEEVQTSGNPLAHAILRGSTNEYGKNIPNFYYDDILDTINTYEKMGLQNPFIVIDTNHDNSGKRYLEQVRIVRQTLINRDWNEKINKFARGFMIESYLEDGRQDTPEVYGKSITDLKQEVENREMGIHKISSLIDTAEVRKAHALTGDDLAKKQVNDSALAKIIKGEDDRLLLVIGPCSSDNEKAVLDYAHRLSKLQEEVKDKIFIVMRVYTAKPRTNGDGYKGLVHQPDSEGATDLITGIKAVRRLQSRIIRETGLPLADEMLYPTNLIYFEDLLSYHAIGARSVEDQEHRFAASGLDVPTGLKNPTSGNLNVMFNAIYAAHNEQEFIYNGHEVKTDGNPLAHAILRGSSNEYGQNEVNYHYEDLVKALDKYSEFGLENPFILVDTNHDNSGKNFMEQIRIVREVLLNREWDKRIADTVRGFMIESYLEDGRQDTPEVYGKSITDPCLGWEKTVNLIREIHTTLSKQFMIFGHGIDLQEISAVKKAYDRNPRFAKKVLTPKEWERFESLSGERQMSFLAGRWAGKEAFSKAWGTGIGAVGFKDIEILNNDKGAPVVTQSPFEGNVFISISHSGDFVQASVILEKTKRQVLEEDSL